MGGGTTHELRLQSPRACSVVPVDLIYRTNSKMKLVRMLMWPQSMNSQMKYPFEWGAPSNCIGCMLVKLEVSTSLHFTGVSYDLTAKRWLGFRNRFFPIVGLLIVLSPCCFPVDWLHISLSLEAGFMSFHVVEDQILCFVGSKAWPYQGTWDDQSPWGLICWIFMINSCGWRRA